jgi:hypothetical protein
MNSKWMHDMKWSSNSICNSRKFKCIFAKHKFLDVIFINVKEYMHGYIRYMYIWYKEIIHQIFLLSLITNVDITISLWHHTRIIKQTQALDPTLPLLPWLPHAQSHSHFWCTSFKMAAHKKSGIVLKVSQTYMIFPSTHGSLNIFSAVNGRKF